MIRLLAAAAAVSSPAACVERARACPHRRLLGDRTRGTAGFRCWVSGETMRIEVHRTFLLVGLAAVLGCRQSGSASGGEPATASGGTPGQSEAAAVAPAEPAAAAPWPVTCDEAAARAIAKMGPAGVQRLQGLSKEELIVLHDSLGLNIRNGFGLWGGNDSLLDSCAKIAAGPASQGDCEPGKEIS
jgi:hypothetical protein